MIVPTTLHKPLKRGVEAYLYITMYVMNMLMSYDPNKVCTNAICPNEEKAKKWNWLERDYEGDVGLAWKRMI